MTRYDVAVRAAWLLVVAACHHGAAPAEAPSCQAAADHVRSLLGPERARAVQVGEAFATRCHRDGWSAEARSCVVATTSLASPRGCKALLSDDQRGALDRDLAGIAATPTSTATPPSCADYRAEIASLSACPAIPAAARGALEQTYRELVLAWTRGAYKTPQIAAQCTAMLEGLRQAIAATCGW